MFYFQKMKSVLKCLSLCVSHPFLPLIPSPLPTLPSQAGGYQLPCREQTTVINFAVHLKRQTLSFLTVFLTLLVGATSSSWLPTGRRDVLPGVPAGEQCLAPASTRCPRVSLLERCLPSVRPGHYGCRRGGCCCGVIQGIGDSGSGSKCCWELP